MTRFGAVGAVQLGAEGRQSPSFASSVGRLRLSSRPVEQAQMMAAENDAHHRCWAKEVSPCREGMSREHVITRGIFSAETCVVTGCSPTAKRPQPVRIDDLVTKVLCRRHNSELSPVDAALIDLVNVIREVDRLQAVRSKIAKGRLVTTTRFSIDGPRVERALLKTLLNCATLFRDVLDDWKPPSWLPEVVLGNRPLPEGCGLSIPAKVGDQADLREEFGVHFGQGSGARAGPNAFLLTLRNRRFLITWKVPARSLGTFNIGDQVYDASHDLLYRPKRCEWKHGSRDLLLSFDFDWSGRWTARENRSVVRLRKKYRAPPRRR